MNTGLDFEAIAKLSNVYFGRGGFLYFVCHWSSGDRHLSAPACLKHINELFLRYCLLVCSAHLGRELMSLGLLYEAALLSDIC